MAEKLAVDEIRKILQFISKGYKVPEVVYETIKKVAKKEVEDKERVVLVKRDPDIGSGRIQAMYVKIIDGSTVEFYPPAVVGFGADFDGDTTYSFVLTYDKLFNKSLEPRRIHISEFNDIYNCRLVETKTRPDGVTIEDYKVLDKVYVKSIDKSNGDIEYKRITNWSIHKNLDMYKFERRKNNSIITDMKDVWISKRHSLIVFNTETGFLEKKSPIEIKDNPSRYFLIRSTVENNINTNIISPNILFEDYARKSIVNDDELGYFCGAWLGDGYITQDDKHENYIIALSNTNKDLGNKWCDILENISTNKIVRDYNSTGISKNGYKNKFGELYNRATRWYVYDTRLQKIIKSNFSCRSENKHLPSWINNTTDDFIIGLIAGYTDTDGTSTGKYITWTTKSKKLADDLKYVLWYRFGVDASIGNNIVKYKYGSDGRTKIKITNPDEYRHYYVVQVRSKAEYKDFFYKILDNMVVDERKEKIRKCFDNLSNNISINNKLKFIPSELKYEVTSDDMANKYDFSKNDVRYQINKNNYTLKNIPISDDIINTLDSETLKTLMKKQENNEIEFIPCSMLDIEYDPEMTIGYDFSVEDYCTFTTDTGIFLWDSVSITVPISEESQDEAKKKMVKTTSNEGMNTENFELSKEMLVGLYSLTDQDNGGSYKEVRSVDDLYKMDVGERVRIKLKNQMVESTAGRVIFNSLLPIFSPFVDQTVDKKILRNILTNIIQTDKSAYANTIDKLVKAAFYYATIYPQTISIDMLAINDELETLKAKLRESRTVEEQSDILDEMKEVMMEHIKVSAPDLYAYIKSGASKGGDQVRQIMISKGLITDPSGNVLPPIQSSISDGYKPDEYFNASAGARAGIISKALGTAEGGYEYRKVIYVTGDVRADISIPDCGTKETLEVKLTKDLYKRLYGRKVVDERGKIIPISEDMIGKIIQLRSPIYCKSKNICRTCYGDLLLQLNSKNVGIISAQEVASLAERFMKSSYALVYTEDGLMPSMSYLWDEVFKDVDTIVDGDLETKNLDNFNILGKTGITKVNCIQKHPPRDKMLFIKTKSGLSMVCQADHPLIIKKSNLHDKYRNSKEFKDLDNECEIREAKYVNKYDSIWIDKTHVKSNNSNIEPDISGYLCGCFIVDGNSLDTDGGTKGFSVDQKRLNDIVLGRYSYEKHLNPDFINYSDTWLRGFLSGLIDADGCIIQTKSTIVRIFTSSYYLIQQLEMICIKLGYHFGSYLTNHRDVCNTHNFCFDITFHSKDTKLNSLKLDKFDIIPKSGNYTNEYVDRGFDLITIIKEIPNWDYPVYDLKTESNEFMAGCIQTHNSFHTGGMVSFDKVQIQKELMINISDNYEDIIKKETRQEEGTENILYLNSDVGKIEIDASQYEGQYKIDEEDDYFKLPIGIFYLTLGEHIKIPVSIERELKVFKTDNIEGSMKSQLIIHYTKGDKLFHASSQMLDYSKATQRLDELISGKAPTKDVTMLYGAFFRTMAPTGGWDSVHLEVLISNCLRWTKDPQIPARLKRPFEFDMYPIKQLPSIISWPLGLAFENMGSALQYGLISDRGETSEIEKVILGEPLSEKFK